MDAAILEHHDQCRRRTTGVLMWAIGMGLASILSVTAWAYQKANQLSVVEARLNSMEVDITQMTQDLKTLPRVEEKLDLLLASRRP